MKEKRRKIEVRILQEKLKKLQQPIVSSSESSSSSEDSEEEEEGNNVTILRRVDLSKSTGEESKRGSKVNEKVNDKGATALAPGEAGQGATDSLSQEEKQPTASLLTLSRGSTPASSPPPVKKQKVSTAAEFIPLISAIAINEMRDQIKKTVEMLGGDMGGTPSVMSAILRDAKRVIYAISNKLVSESYHRLKKHGRGCDQSQSRKFLERTIHTRELSRYLEERATECSKSKTIPDNEATSAVRRLQRVDLELRDLRGIRIDHLTARK